MREIAGLDQIRMIEIKLSQGAKPGKGGLLPKEKITEEIAELRGVPMGKDVVSPPYHVECTSPEATVAFIRRVQEVAGLPVGIKLCLGRETDFQALVQAMKRCSSFPDYITIDGMGTSGRFIIGLIEGFAAFLLLTPNMPQIGALLGFGTMMGALIAHTTVLGLDINADGGIMVAMMVVVVLTTSAVMYIRRRDLPLIGRAFED